MPSCFKKIAIFIPMAAVFPWFAMAQPQDVVSPIINQMTNGVRILIALTFLLAIFFFAWGIIKLIIAAGDPEKIKEARGFLLWGVIGIAVLASIFGLITFLQNYFGITPGGGQIPIPTVQ